MIQIEDKIVSFDLFDVKFSCDLSHCRGICCVEGNAGAPLNIEEVDILEEEYPAYAPYLTPEGVEVIEREGFMVVDIEGDYTTPLIDDAACAYAYTENGITLCAIEKAYRAGKTTFPKPISCHLYPIRLAHFSNGTIGLNYHRWGICSGAVCNGEKEGIPLYKALQAPITRRFGADFYAALEEADRFIQSEKEK